MPADLKDYRAARRAFIAACEKAGVDTIARVHPGKAADGKPLFLDTAALGPRLAQKAVMVIGQDKPGSAALTALLHARVAPPEDARLVLVHALDPAAFAGNAGNDDWPLTMLFAVATEDLSRVQTLTVLALGSGGAWQKALDALPRKTVIRALPPRNEEEVIAQIQTALAAL